MSLQDNSEEYLTQLERKYGDGRQAEFKKESSQVWAYFQAVAVELSATYEIENVLAVGGTGIVHVGHHKRFNQSVVVKINRPNIAPEEVSMVDNESRVLPGLSHPNIIRVLDLGEIDAVKPKVTYIVEPFIRGSRAFYTNAKERVPETWLHAEIAKIRKALPTEPGIPGAGDTAVAMNLVSVLLSNLAALFAQWVSLLSHIHAAKSPKGDGYVYLDVKPENVLIDEHQHLTSIDFGSSEALDRSDQTPVDVFFTERYAHPDLMKRKKEKASSNRVRGSIKRSDIRETFDYYALGISMLEILHAVASTRPHVIPQLPLYRSLHFLASRLLDGQNAKLTTEHDYTYAPQVFPSLQESDYSVLKYDSLFDAERDLEKERGRWNLDVKVPELAPYSKDIVRLVPGYNTVLTARLRSLIEHPLVARLKYVSQLGLVSLVYPTADHSRYDHALGSYTYTTYYVKGLFNDLGNPLFRGIVGEQELNAVLLAALLHDLGQYPLAHDLEEVHDRIFKHGRIGAALLADPMQDSHKRSLIDIVENPDNGWGVSPGLLERILGATTKNIDLVEGSGTDERDASFKADVLAAIIDGPVDADKADYIIRDSSRCELPYGAQLDIERLLRVLTVAIIPEEVAPERRITLGVYDKGLASAHAFGQARYQLLSTVYWHHTSRVAKAMLQYATAIGLPREVFGPHNPDRDRKETEIRERLLGFIKALVPPFALPSGRPQSATTKKATPSLDLAAPAPESIISAIEEPTVPTADSDPAPTDWYPGIAWTDWLMLRWITELPKASDASRGLVHGIQTRRLYKRIASFQRNGSYDDIVQALDSMRWPDLVDLCQKLHARICGKLAKEWANLDTAATVSKPGFEKLRTHHMIVLLDVPNPSRKIGYERPLGVVPELKEKSYHQDSRQATEDKNWRDIMVKMIQGVAPVRLLCHPDLRNLVSVLYAPVETRMARELRELLGLKV